MSTNVIDSRWTRGQSETTTFIEWFQSSEQNGSRIRIKKNLSGIERSIMLSLIARLGRSNNN